MNYFKAAAGLINVVITILLFSIINQIIHVDSQNIPSLGLLHYMYKTYPNMKLRHCIKAANQCQMFTSCKGLYLHLPTGECLFDNSKVKDKEFISTTTEPESLTTTESLVSAAITNSSLLNNQTTKTILNETTATTTKSSTEPVSMTTESTTEPVSVTAESTTELVSMTTKSTTEIATTQQPYTNYTSIHFTAKSTDHKIYDKSFDTGELSTCFWMKPDSTDASSILIFFQSPVNDRSYECNDLILFFYKRKLYFTQKHVPTTSNPAYLVTEKIFLAHESNHVCFAWNATQFVFYVNGVFDKKYEIDHDRLVANYFAVGNDLDDSSYVCHVNDPNQSFIGKIAGLNIWNRVLNGTEFKRVYWNGYISSNELAVVWRDVLNFDTTDNIKKEEFVE